MWPATTAELWQAFGEAGVMVSCVRYGERDRRYGPEYREALECEVIYCPANLPDVPIPPLVRVTPRSELADPVTLCVRNASVADVILREIIRSTGLRFRFSGANYRRRFNFDGPNPTVQVEPEQEVLFGEQTVSAELSPVEWLASPCLG